MSSLRQYDWIVHLITIAFCAFFLAKALSTYVGGALEGTSEKELAVEAPLVPEAPSEAIRGEEETPYQVILDRNIFNAAESATSESGEGEVDESLLGEAGPAVKTNLGVKVLGTLVVGEGTDRRSSAVISSDKGSKGGEAYFPGDEKSFAPNVKLTKVSRDRIEFVNGGRLEFAELVDFVGEKSIFASPEEVHGKGSPVPSATGSPVREPGAVADSGSKVLLDQGEIDQALQNLDKLYTDVRIVPNFKDGTPAGMKVLSVKPGSLVSKLGIRRGDVLEKINGQELDVQKGMELFSSMKDLKTFSVDVVRGGKNQTLEYEIR